MSAPACVPEKPACSKGGTCKWIKFHNCQRPCFAAGRENTKPKLLVDATSSLNSRQMLPINQEWLSLPESTGEKDIPERTMVVDGSCPRRVMRRTVFSQNEDED